MKVQQYILALLLVVFTLPAAADPVDLAKRRYLSPQEAASLQQKVILLDVRSAEEWRAGHIKGAVHIPYDQVPDKISTIIPDRSVPIVIYCASGGRARYVIGAVRKLGYTAVPVMKGGYRQLVDSGMVKSCPSC